MTKSELRSEMKRKEKDFLASGASVDETRDIWAAIEGSADFQRAGTVLIYMDIPGEVPTGDFITRWSGVKRFVIPLVCGDELLLKYYDPERLVSGYRGILEPSADAEDVPVEAVELALVPGVAFVRPDGTAFPQCVAAPGEVFRMGRGKGFYDRLVPKLKCRCMAVGYSFRWVDALPLDPWDAPLK